MNILLINHYAGSPVHGMEYRPYYFAREWARMGHTVTIAAASHSHLRSVDPECGGVSRIELIDGIRYAWFWTPSYAGNGIKRVLNIGAFVLQLLLHRTVLAEACKGGVVIGSSTYPLDVVAANAIAGSARAKLVYEVHDLWPLSPIELGGMSTRHPFIQVMQWGEDFAYRKATRVISMLPLAEPHMREHGLDPGKFAYVPNGIDVTEWRDAHAALPEIHQRALARLKKQNRFLIGYAGAHGLANSLDSIVRAAKMVGQSGATFVLVGQGPEKRRLEGLAARIGAVNIEFLPPVPKAAVPLLLSMMDVLVITLQRASLFRFGISPNKLMDYMMAGRPIIQAIDAGNDLVAEAGCGMSASPGNPEAIAAAVFQMMKLSPLERSAMGLRGKQYVGENHDYRLLAARCLEGINRGIAVPDAELRKKTLASGPLLERP